MKLVECVPNFSEGRDKDIINAITAEIKKINNVILLDVDSGVSTNRTVVTFVGSPDDVLGASFCAIKKASELIDMSKHKGAHPRMGATDVCPFIPVSEVTMEECVILAQRLGKRVGEELDIPVYLYEYAAKKETRKSLSNIRVGEYEGLESKLKQYEWRPDFGNAKFNKKSGAIVIGARKFLIAYNINLNTRNTKLAKVIGLNIRETGRIKKDKDGCKLCDENGVVVREPGLLQCCKATGWLVEEYQRAQVTMNLTDFEKTPIHLAFDTVVEEARKLGVRVTGSEIVGLVPKEALISAGKHYLKLQGMTQGISEKEIIETAIISLGLNDVAEFNPEKKIIEYQFEKNGKLANMKLVDFLRELASSSPAPGGGSVAALSGALSSSLSGMVSALTFSKKGYESVKEKMEDLGVKLQKLKEIQIKKIDEDTTAFNKVMESYSLPKTTPEEKAQRERAIMIANIEATNVPMSVLKLSKESIEIAYEMVLNGNKNSLSDAGVSALMAEASALGAYYNVLINLPAIKDEKWVSKTKEEAERIVNEVSAIASSVKEEVLKRFT